MHQAKKELECERSQADALISTFSEPEAMGGQLPPNTASQQNQHQQIPVPPVPTQYQFNLTGITPPIPPKWKHNENLLNDYRKFRRSCQWIFDGPMTHVPDGKIKTNMFLIWAGPDGEDIYDNFKLPPNCQYNVDYVLDKFKEFCQPLCNFSCS